MYLTLFISNSENGKTASILYDTKIAQPRSISTSQFYNYFMFDSLIDCLKAAEYILKYSVSKSGQITLSIKKDMFYFLGISIK